MRVLIGLLCCCVLSVAGQERKINSKIKVVDEYTTSNYSCPDSIIFYAGQEGEIETNFKELFRKIERKLNRKGGVVSTYFDDDLNSVNRVQDFEDLIYDRSNINSRYVCIVGLGNTSRAMKGMPEERTISFEEAELYWIYDFYILLIDLKTESVVLSRKLNIMSERLFDKGNQQLVKAIGKELKII